MTWRCRLIYLDADMLVLRNIDHLFDLSPGFYAGEACSTLKAAAQLGMHCMRTEDGEVAEPVLPAALQPPTAWLVGSRGRSARPARCSALTAPTTSTLVGCLSLACASLRGSSAPGPDLAALTAKERADWVHPAQPAGLYIMSPSRAELARFNALLAAGEVVVGGYAEQDLLNEVYKVGWLVVVVLLA